MLSAYGQEWNDSLPLTETAPYEFTSDTTAVDTLRTKLSLNYYATAQNCVDTMIKRYGLENLKDDDLRTVMGVRYTMERSDFSISNPFTFAEDISTELMLVISEQYKKDSGVEISIVTYRDYKDDSVAVHILGTIGKLDSKEWQELSGKGYSYDDYVGKSGVEKAFEEYLKGTDGEITYTLDNLGNIVSAEVTKEPIQGNSVYLSIDSKLQLVAQDVLASNIKQLNAKGSKITGGAVVVTEVETGQVLVCANYPTYSLSQYYNSYSELVNNKISNPLFNRAFNGQYAPGSVFKPLVAIAGLDLKIIDRNSTVNCVRKYTYYDDYQPSCMHRHGILNVIGGISESCNYFFFDVGRRTGITNLNKYARLFGLGEPTGIEVVETAGILAGPEYSSSKNQRWYDGNTLAASIGQLDNAFSPLQLAMYTSTIANGGTRYRATLLNKVTTPTGEDVMINSPVVINETGIAADVLDIVKQGMRSVTAEGTASTYFNNYSIAVGGKTGTAQNTGADHNAFTVFAPYEDPEIAITVYVEHGEHSISTGPIAKAILDAYFFVDRVEYSEPQINELLR